MLREQGLDDIVVNHLKLMTTPPDMTEWEALVKRVKSLHKKTEIAIVGKYVALHDAYLSIVESLGHAGIALESDVDIRWVNAEEVTDRNAADLLQGVHGILVPGGFGDRGIEGKVAAIRYARENNVPFFGICLGMQVAVIEYARNVCGLDDANRSTLLRHTRLSTFCQTRRISKIWEVRCVLACIRASCCQARSA
jgi:CTP synthase